MWEDVKKIGGLLFDQTKEQKDIVLLKLREVSYKNKKEDAFSRLGQNVFNLLSASEPVTAENDSIKSVIDEIKEIDSEIEKINELVESLKTQAASDRDVMATEVSTVWEKTKSALSKEEEQKQESSPPKETATKATATDEEKEEKTKAPKAKSETKKTDSDSGKKKD